MATDESRNVDSNKSTDGVAGSGDSEEPKEGTVGTSASDTNSEGDDGDLGEKGLKALAAERDARKKAEREYKDLEAKFTDASTKADELKTKNNELLDKVKSLEAANLRASKAYEAGLPVALIEFITGTDEETIDGQISKLLDNSVHRPPAPVDTLGNNTERPPSNASVIGAAIRDALNS